MSRFDEFWAAWPKNQRKVDRGKCAEKWKARNLDAIADTILTHVEWSKRKNEEWHKGLIPMPATYINQSRWEAGTGNEDLRPRARASAPNEQKPVDDDMPKLSRYGRAGNKMLLQFITRGGPICRYPESPKKCVPAEDTGPLEHVLAVKRAIVEDAEMAHRNGDPWSDEDFLSILENGLREAISEAREMSVV